MRMMENGFQSDECFIKEMRESIQEDAQQLFLHALQGGTIGVYLEKDLPLCFISDELLTALGYTYEQFTSAYNDGFLKAIHPEDRDSCCTVAQDDLKYNQIYEKACRILGGDGQYIKRRNLGKCIRTLDGRNAILILSLDMSQTLEYQQELEQRVIAYEESSSQLEKMTANIPGGVCEILLDEYYTMVYGNEGIFTLYGYTREQMIEEHQNRLYQVIYEKDRNTVRQIIRDAIHREKKGIQFEHRVVRRDGGIVWVLVKGNFSEHKGVPILNCVILDITTRKKMEDEVRISEARFRIALAMTDSSIFEYDIKAKLMIHGDKSAEYYGLEKYTQNVPESLLENGTVHADNQDVYLEMYRKICSGDETATCILKTRSSTGNYVWREITMTTIYDEYGTPVQAVGVLADIDAQVRREEKLLYQSERDTLTGVYNRGTMVRHICQKLESVTDDIKALLVMDLDSFKLVNDRHGHMYGDYVLMETARRISEAIDDQAFVGRIGGDEFMFLIHGFSSIEDVKVYVETILSVFKEPYDYNGIVTEVRGSIGAAICPSKESYFEELYQNADIALYEAKSAGRNQAVFYTPDMRCEGEWVLKTN